MKFNQRIWFLTFEVTDGYHPYRFDMLHAQLGTLLENAQYLLADSAPAVSLTATGAGGQYGYSRAIDGHHHVRSNCLISDYTQCVLIGTC